MREGFGCSTSSNRNTECWQLGICAICSGIRVNVPPTAFYLVNSSASRYADQIDNEKYDLPDLLSGS